MKPNFVTETVEEKIPLWLYCQPGVVRDTLETILRAADFVIAEEGEEKPYAVIIVGEAAFAGKREALAPEVPTYWIRFNSGGGRIIPGAFELTYEQVFAPRTPSLSLLDELTRRLVFDSAVEVRGGRMRTYGVGRCL